MIQRLARRFGGLAVTLGAFALAGCETQGASLAELAAAADRGHSESCADEDGDGFGVGCPSGRDCDDADATATNGCYRCETPNEGCPCDTDAAVVPCGYEVSHVGVTTTCAVGERRCAEGVWGACDADGVTTKTVEPAALYVQGTTQPTPCTNSPCDPLCNDYDADPTVGNPAIKSPDGVSLAPGDGSVTGDPTDCGTTQTEARQIPLGMQLLLDRSGSMDGSRWTNVTSAVKAFVKSPSATGLYAGLDFFPSDDDECSGGQYAGANVSAQIDLLPGSGNAHRKSIVNAINAMYADGGTPMLPAVQGAILQARNWALGGASRKGVVVLVTDGYPESCGACESKKGKSAKNLAACRVGEVADAVEMGFYGSPSVETFVIGVGDNLDFLNIIARSGSGGRRDAIIVQGAGDAATLQAKLDEIRNLSLSCEYPIARPTQGVIDPAATLVTFAPSSGAPRTLEHVATPGDCGSEDGFYFDSRSSKLLLCPKTCTDAKADLTAKVKLEFSCFPTCTSMSEQGQPGAHDLFVMMDRSGSMSDEANGVTLWAAASGAMRNFVRSPDVAGMGLGVSFFPPSTECDLCCANDDRRCVGYRDCAGEEAACRAPCDAARAACRAPCEATGTSCRTSCLNTGSSCRNGCVPPWNACNASCDANAPTCVPKCETARTDCKNKCSGGFFGIFCRASCDSAYNSCASKCTNCKSNCTSAKNNCTNGCNDRQDDCTDDCNDNQDGCTDDCENTYYWDCNGDDHWWWGRWGCVGDRADCDDDPCIYECKYPVPWPYCDSTERTSCTAPPVSGPLDGRYGYRMGYSGTCNASDFVDFSKGGVPIGTLPGAGRAQESALYRAFISMSPEGGTPTKPALQGALDYAKSHAVATPASVTSVVLVTDGEPNECSSNNNNVASLAKTFFDGTPSVPTYVVGVGGGLTGLNQVAKSGSGGRYNAFLVDQQNPTQFIEAMRQISKLSMNCSFDVPKPTSGTLDLASPKVVVTHASGATDLTQVGSASACGTKRAWYYDVPAAPKKIILCPEACALARADAEPRVDVLYECLTVFGASGEAVFEFAAPNCPLGTAPVWKDWSWEATTPSDSRITFAVQTGDRDPVTGVITNLSAKKSLIFTTATPNPPMSAAYQALDGKAVCAGNKTCAGIPLDTQTGGLLGVGSGEVFLDQVLGRSGLARHPTYLKITSTLWPSSDKKSAPTLKRWGVQATCLADQ